MKIQRLRLYTSNLQQQKRFYAETLGLPTQDADDGGLVVEAGATMLTFFPAEEPYYYHFAFNISPYQYDAALAWLKSRVIVLSDNGTELIDFSNWNAYAMYFEDAGGNIVEFIARRDLELPEVVPFGSQAIHSVSEIGLSVRQVGEAFDVIHRETALPFYSGNRSNFCAAGDPEGLFILVDPEDKDWYPADRPARMSPLEVHFEEQGQVYKLSLEAGNITITR